LGRGLAGAASTGFEAVCVFLTMGCLSVKVP
jgi:hypothetical protein